MSEEDRKVMEQCKGVVVISAIFGAYVRLRNPRMLGKSQQKKFVSSCLWTMQLSHFLPDTRSSPMSLIELEFGTFFWSGSFHTRNL